MDRFRSREKIIFVVFVTIKTSSFLTPHPRGLFFALVLMMWSCSRADWVMLRTAMIVIIFFADWSIFFLVRLSSLIIFDFFYSLLLMLLLLVSSAFFLHCMLSFPLPSSQFVFRYYLHFRFLHTSPIYLFLGGFSLIDLSVKSLSVLFDWIFSVFVNWNLYNSIISYLFTLVVEIL